MAGENRFLWIAKEAASIADDDDSYNQTLLILVSSCSADLKAAGVKMPVESHPRYEQALRFYVKAYGWTEPDGERWEKCYTALRASMKHDYGDDDEND